MTSARYAEMEFQTKSWLDIVCSYIGPCKSGSV